MFARAAATVIAVCLSSCMTTYADGSQRMWYRGSFDGWVEHRSSPWPGHYYSPSPSATGYYDVLIYCPKCSYRHHLSDGGCPNCGYGRPKGSHARPQVIYSPRRMPGAYYYKKQPHYRFRSPIRLGGSYMKYDQRWD